AAAIQHHRRGAAELGGVDARSGHAQERAQDFVAHLPLADTSAAFAASLRCELRCAPMLPRWALHSRARSAVPSLPLTCANTACACAVRPAAASATPWCSCASG